MFKEKDENSSPVAYMYEFDCKPSIPIEDTQDKWFTIMNEHEVRYVLFSYPCIVEYIPLA